MVGAGGGGKVATTEGDGGTWVRFTRGCVCGGKVFVFVVVVVVVVVVVGIMEVEEDNDDDNMDVSVTMGGGNFCGCVVCWWVRSDDDDDDGSGGGDLLETSKASGPCATIFTVSTVSFVF
mmetsp:Transcript_762/g.907  ORF Transcript_762/g.907 Transcript_762/m.907 type:complete len:120 (+) Transcript_762:567-926(+)